MHNLLEYEVTDTLSIYTDPFTPLLLIDSDGYNVHRHPNKQLVNNL